MSVISRRDNTCKYSQDVNALLHRWNLLSDTQCLNKFLSINNYLGATLDNLQV